MEVKSLKLKRVIESKGEYDLMNPVQVVGRLTQDGILLPVTLMDHKENWHKIPFDEAKVLDAFLEAETSHIEENKHDERNGGIPVSSPERDSASIKIRYWKSGALKDSLHLYVVEARKEFQNPCRKSSQTGLLVQHGEEAVYIPRYYFAGDCWGKASSGSTFPIVAFSYKNRIFIMEEQYGYEGMDFSVYEVLLESDVLRLTTPGSN